VASTRSVSSSSNAPVLDGAQNFGKSAAFPSALLVSNIQEDHRILAEIFSQNQWMLFRTATVRTAISIVRENEIPVVISDRDVPDGGWKKLLSAFGRLSRPPLLVVTSRLADEYLWAEVLNLGGHDVLATPFNPRELGWVLESAWHTFACTFGASVVTAGATAF